MIVVADTSVILNLCCVGYDTLLRKIYGRVCVPIQVNEEFSRLTQGAGRFSGCTFPSWISVLPPSLECPAAVKAADLDKGNRRQ